MSDSSLARGTDAPWDTSATDNEEAWTSRTTESNRPREVGSYYEATVPDTLDLAERARLGINNFTEMISEEHNYEMYWGTMAARYPKDIMEYVGKGDWTQWGYDFGETNPPVLNMQFSALQACQPKCMEAMVMQRLMSGSQQHLEREAKMLEMMASYIAEDGLFYAPDDPEKWWLGPPEDRPWAYSYASFGMIRAMMVWYQYTGLPVWKERIDRVVDGLDRHMLVHKEDYAYVPAHGWPEPMYFHPVYIKGRGWKDTSEPQHEREGDEDSLFCLEGYAPGVLANCYALTGNEQALRMSGELVRFLTKPKFWANWKGGEYPGVVGAEHAHWTGHFHGHMSVLRAVLEYAIVANDAHLKSFVRDGYEWTRQQGFACIGLIGDGQGCGCGRLIGLAVKLTDAGVGDYWEDIDLYVRNQGIESQFTPEDIPRLKRLSEGKPPPPEDASFHSGEDVYAMNVGGYCDHAPGKTGTAGCCSPWGNMGLFYAWDSTIRYSDGVARVNLLLNRASPWMDIDSYLPYEGKVVIRNKEAQEAFVRIPLWVDRQAVRCRIGELEVQPRWFESRLRFDQLKKGDVLTIEFPVEERTEEWSAPPPSPGDDLSRKFLLRLPEGARYSMRFRGNTLVEIDPPLAPDTPMYRQRPEMYKAARAPMKEVKRYVSPLVLRW